MWNSLIVVKQVVFVLNTLDNTKLIMKYFLCKVGVVFVWYYHAPVCCKISHEEIVGYISRIHYHLLFHPSFCFLSCKCFFLINCYPACWFLNVLSNMLVFKIFFKHICVFGFKVCVV